MATEPAQAVPTASTPVSGEAAPAEVPASVVTTTGAVAPTRGAVPAESLDNPTVNEDAPITLDPSVPNGTNGDDEIARILDGVGDSSKYQELIGGLDFQPAISAAAPIVTPPAAATSEAPNGEQPSTARETPAAPATATSTPAKDDEELPDRVRIKSLPQERQALIMKLLRNPDAPVEALLPPTPAAPTTAETPVAAAPTRPAKDVEADIERMEEQMDEATRTFDGEAQATLRKQMRDARKELSQSQVAERQTRQRAAEQLTERNKALDVSEQRAVERYPDVVNVNSALVGKMKEIDQRLKTVGDPLFYSPNKPLLLTQMAAEEIGIAPVRTASTPVAGATPVAPAQPSLTPVPRAASAVPASSTVQPAPANARTSVPTAAASGQVLSGLLNSVTDTDAFNELMDTL